MNNTITVGLYCAICKLLARDNDRMDYLKYSGLIIGML